MIVCLRRTTKRTKVHILTVTRGYLKNIFNTEVQRNRATQSFGFQFYSLCVAPNLCTSVFKFFTFEMSFKYYSANHSLCCSSTRIKVVRLLSSFNDLAPT